MGREFESLQAHQITQKYSIDEIIIESLQSTDAGQLGIRYAASERLRLFVKYGSLISDHTSHQSGYLGDSN